MINRLHLGPRVTVFTHEENFTKECWNKTGQLTSAVCELEKSVIFLGPLGAWNEKNVPHDGGKFLRCQRTSGFHKFQKPAPLGSISGRTLNKEPPQLSDPESGLLAQMIPLIHFSH